MSLLFSILSNCCITCRNRPLNKETMEIHNIICYSIENYGQYLSEDYYMHKVKVIGNTLLVIGILLLLIACITDYMTPLLSIAGIVAACMGYVFFWLFWRCPHCGRHLPMQGMLFIEVCPYCSKELDK